LFENEFLISNPESKKSYQQLIAKTIEVLLSSLPDLAYSGKHATELSSIMGSVVFPRVGSPVDEIFNNLREIVSNSVMVSHPNAAAHLHCPPLTCALTAEVVINALNQSMDSFDQAPIATLLEQQMIRWLAAETALPTTAGGTFTTGGTQSNYMGLLLARDAFLQSRWNWSAQKSGLPPEARRLRILCSEEAHFSVEKAASQLGLGTDAVVKVGVDEQFGMKLGSLKDSVESLRKEGMIPLSIVATAGTTNFGSIDPLPEVSSVAKKAGAWFHVDAAYGGALLFSARHRDRLSGIESADSVAIDFHKLLWQPIPCAAFLVRDARHFDSMKLHADYLNPQFHDEQGIPNLVTTSLLTTRRFDALKLWISLHSLGQRKLGAMLDRTLELARVAAEAVRTTPHLELLHESVLTTVLFRYVPSRPNIDVDQFNARLRQLLFDRGIAVIGHTRVGGGRRCLKFTCMNPTVSDAQMQALVQIISSTGKQLEKEEE
jgi:L-2,4-diaminobutyrate decarboxylase